MSSTFADQQRPRIRVQMRGWGVAGSLDLTYAFLHLAPRETLMHHNSGVTKAS
jgi:hypothetical protein